MKKEWLASGLFILFGLGLLGLARIGWKDQREFLAHALPEGGVVVEFTEEEYEVREDDRRRTEIGYSPVIEFTDQDERIFRFSSQSSSNPPD